MPNPITVRLTDDQQARVARLAPNLHLVSELEMLARSTPPGQLVSVTQLAALEHGIAHLEGIVAAELEDRELGEAHGHE